VSNFSSTKAQYDFWPMLATAQEKDRWFALNPSSWPDEVLLVSGGGAPRGLHRSSDEKRARPVPKSLTCANVNAERVSL
jgi:hypothetical protein